MRDKSGKPGKVMNSSSVIYRGNKKEVRELFSVSSFDIEDSGGLKHGVQVNVRHTGIKCDTA